MTDAYVLPNGTLANLLGLMDQDDLSAAEADIAALNQARLEAENHAGPWDTNFLLGLHAELFGQVYEWAGEIRTGTLSKRVFEDRGLTIFTPPRMIRSALDTIFEQMSQTPFETLPQDKFATWVAPFLVFLNNIHPFREGNGRTQRLMLRKMAAFAGHDLSWDVISRERMAAASVLGARGEVAPMTRLLLEALDRRRVHMLRQAIVFFDANSFDWNDVYLSTTETGQEYRGRLVSRSPSDFILRVEADGGDWIVVGDVGDLPDTSRIGQSITVKADSGR